MLELWWPSWYFVSSDQVSLYSGLSWICSGNEVSQEWFRTFDYRFSHTATSLMYKRPGVAGIHHKARWIWPSSGGDRAHCKQCLCCEFGMRHNPSYSSDSSESIDIVSGDSGELVVSADNVGHEVPMVPDLHVNLDINTTDLLSHNNLSLFVGSSKGVIVPDFSLVNGDANEDVTIIDLMEDGFVPTGTVEKSGDGHLAGSRSFFVATSFFLVVVVVCALLKLYGFVCKDSVSGTLPGQSGCEIGYDAICKIRRDCNEHESGFLSGQSDCENGSVSWNMTRDD